MSSPLPDEPFCAQLARRFRIEGYDQEDLLQEARLAMWKTGRTDNYARTAAWNRLRDLAKRCREPYANKDWAPHEQTIDSWDSTVRLLDFRRTLPLLTPLERRHLAASIQGFPAHKAVVSNARIKLRKAA